MLSWWNRFSLSRGPLLGFRNPISLGFAYRFPTPGGPLPPTSLHWEEARDLWNTYGQKAERLRTLSQAMLTIVVTAILFYELGWGTWLIWLFLMALFLGLHVSLIFFYDQAHRELFPDDPGSRWKNLLLCLFSPWQSSRAMDLLGEKLFSPYHPFAVAMVLLGEEERNRFYRRWMLELKYPAIHPQAPKDSPVLLAKDPRAELRLLRFWLVQEGLNYQASLPTPRPSQPTQKSYCPRCEVEYSLEKGKCNDCGLELAAF